MDSVQGLPDTVGFMTFGAKFELHRLAVIAFFLSWRPVVVRERTFRDVAANGCGEFGVEHEVGARGMDGERA